MKNREVSPEEFLQQINMIRLNDQMSWIEQNNAILKLIKERDTFLNTSKAQFLDVVSSKSAHWDQHFSLN